MAGSVTRATQTLPISSAIQQGAAHITGSSTPLDGTTIYEPYVIVLDENDPGRKVSPADEATLQAIVTALAGTLTVAPLATNTATLSNFPAATTATALLAANSARTGVIVHNDSTSSTLYIAYATAAGDATLTHFSVKLLPGAMWEMPRPIYRNVLSGIWDGTSGAARVTELS